MRLDLSFPRDPACFSSLAVELGKSGALRTLAFTDMEIHAPDIAAISGALVSETPNSRVERIELLNCNINTRTLSAL